MKKIIAISGSPNKKGNTAIIINWFAEGARSLGSNIEIVHVSDLKYKIAGCASRRKCQKIAEYRCVIKEY
jgi:multimeric flavodoxin WrbA